MHPFRTTVLTMIIDGRAEHFGLKRDGRKRNSRKLFSTLMNKGKLKGPGNFRITAILVYFLLSRLICLRKFRLPNFINRPGMRLQRYLLSIFYAVQEILETCSLDGATCYRNGKTTWSKSLESTIPRS